MCAKSGNIPACDKLQDLLLEVWDKDTLTKDDFMGQARLESLSKILQKEPLEGGQPVCMCASMWLILWSVGHIRGSRCPGATGPDT